ncbi:hypothetical protein [Phyllobacterium sp. K27]
MREEQFQLSSANCAWFDGAHHEEGGWAAKTVVDIKEYGLQSTHLPHGEPRRTTHYKFATSGAN